ncbi:50S ribosomal protein L17 [bacterium (Candidatus Torokbacteria) CG_4_10_14_0_2_um_filter_35_8]|nr:MAG: 50S ribosomal protein L17 [bacterium (Candidatus Torokbacteria) CG_4_10_14_0_2_um_filter_35_8]
MEHKVKGRKFKRNAKSRKALMRGLACALINREKIKTTLAKAKELRPFTERLITKAKKGTPSQKKKIISILDQKKAYLHLIRDLSKKYIDRNGGYTRIVKLGPRKGDGAEMAIIELI